jgi:alpha-L-fucosidase
MNFHLSNDDTVCFIGDSITHAGAYQTKDDPASVRWAQPTPEHVAWADAEVGVIIHHDLQVYDPRYRVHEGPLPAAAAFNPSALDTDQWLATAKAAGARYAVLVAKHGSGFCLWPTTVHDYSVRNTPWRNGRGDVVADFIASCRRHHIRPGLYYSTTFNSYLKVKNPGRVVSGLAEDQRRYNDVVARQLTELWTNYGPLFEIWFDGGVIPEAVGGPPLRELIERLQPQALCFQGPEGGKNLRWIGNERGEAPDPCWSTVDWGTAEDGVTDRTDLGGTPTGRYWYPGESDMPNRDQERAFLGGWFWKAGEDQFLYPVEHLVERYYQSVGRNTNLLLGMVIDDRGRVPDADVQQFTEFGRRIRRLFEHCLGETAGTGNVLELSLGQPTRIDQVVLQEDIAGGERVRRYVIEGLADGRWTTLAAGQSIGHKRIARFAPAAVGAVRFRAVEAVATPRMRRLQVYSSLARGGR